MDEPKKCPFCGGKLKYTNRLIMLANTEWNVQNARCVHQITTNQKKQSKYGIGE